MPITFLLEWYYTIKITKTRWKYQLKVGKQTGYLCFFLCDVTWNCQNADNWNQMHRSTRLWTSGNCPKIPVVRIFMSTGSTWGLKIKMKQFQYKMGTFQREISKKFWLPVRKCFEDHDLIDSNECASGFSCLHSDSFVWRHKGRNTDSLVYIS